ncbi:MAG: DUF1189 family protein, partial [bacterium]|nr:DUF1189 family protein [bacterium]
INPFTLNTYEESISNSLNTIPTNLEISIHKGELNSNLFRPFLFWIKLPKEKFLFLVIDEKAYPEKIKEYESSILLTKNSFSTIYQKRLHTFSYSQFTNNLVLNKSDILKLSSQILHKIKLLLIITSPLLLLVVPLVLFLSTTIYILLSSTIVYIFYRFFNKHYKFIKIVQIGLHSSSLPLFILIILLSLYLWKCIPVYFPLITFLIFQITGVYEAHFNKNNHMVTHHPVTHHKKK